MTPSLHIAAHEANVLRVFALSLDEDAANRLMGVPEGPAALMDLPELNTEFAEIVRISDLDDLGLIGYFEEGYDAQIAPGGPEAQRLRALEGYVLVVLSRAFGGVARDVSLGPALSLVATLPLDDPDWSDQQDLSAESAKPGSAAPTGRKPPSDAAMMGRVATIALLMMFGLTWLVVYLAG